MSVGSTKAASEDAHSTEAVNWREFILYVVGKRHRLRVVNESMLPAFSPQSEILYNPRAYKNQFPQAGEVVVAKHPHQPDLLIIKRVAEVDGKGWVFLLSDNENAGTDSRTWGKVALENILGRVTCRFTSN